jgi:hypothetical protein
MGWLTPLDDDTLLRCQQQLDELIVEIDDLLADIEATAEPNCLAAKQFECEHLGGAVYE